MPSWTPEQPGTQRLVALSQFACVVLFALLLVRPAPAGAVAVRAALVLCLAIFGAAAAAVAVEARGTHRLVFGGFAGIAAMASLLLLRALLLPPGSDISPVGSIEALEMAVGVAALNGVLALYGTYARTQQKHESDLLEERMTMERVLSTTLEQRVVERTTDLHDAQRALRRMWWLGQQITLELDPARVLERFLEATVDTTRAAGAAIGLLDEDGRIAIEAASGPLTALQGRRLPLRDSPMGRVILSGRSWTTDDAAVHLGILDAAAVAALEEGSKVARGLAVVPIVRRGDRIGAVALVAKARRAFTAQEIERVEAMADLLAVALSNAELVETLRRAEWRFRTLFRAAPDAVFTLLQSGRIRDANDAVRELTGIEPSNLTGRFVFELVDEEDRAALSAAITRAIAGSPERLEVRVRRWSVGGEHADRHAAVALSRLPESDPPAALLVARDVTSEREMHVRLMESDRLAAVGELVAGVAHEVNNPLSSISAFAQLLLREESLSEPHRESIAVIHSETQRASQVVKDLLAFARRSAPQREPVDLNVVVARTLRLRQYQLGTQGITLDERLDPGLPAVLGDARQLQQVCLNLVTNAVQAMSWSDPSQSPGAAGASAGSRSGSGMSSGGSLRVATRRVPIAGGSAVVLEVTDTGPGIPAPIRARIFEPFFTTKPEGEGTGLGLSVSYGIVRSHGGSIELADTSPAGTTFRVTLPAADAAAVDSSGAALGPAMLRSPLAGLRLLFVDDEPALCSGMEAFGRLRGFSVVTAEDGLAALQCLDGAGIDAVVCDLRMPRLDGLTFHARLREERPGLASRTVFITGDVVAGASRLGVRQPVLGKPFAFEQLEEVLVGVLRGH